MEKILISIVLLLFFGIVFALYKRFAQRQERMLKECLEDANSGKVNEGIKKAILMTKKFPMSLPAHETLARLYELDHEFYKAAEKYSAILRMSPVTRHEELLTNIGRIYLKAGDLPKAAGIFKELCQMDPDSFRYKMELSSVLLGMEWWVEAAQLLEDVLEQAPDNPTVKNRLATAYLRSGQNEKALGIYSSLIAEDPARITARYHLAEILISKKAWAEALGELEEVLKKATGRLRSCALLEAGNCCLELGNPKNACNYYEEGIDLTADQELVESFRFNIGLSKKLAEGPKKKEQI